MFLVASCKDKKASGAKDGSGVESSDLMESFGDDKFSGFGNLFNLDYTPELPEDEMVPERIGTDYAGASGKSENIVPGLRALDKYKTKYQSKRLSIAEFLKGVLGKKTVAEVKFADSSSGTNKSSSKKSREEFKVSSWGPMENIPGEVEKVEFFVSFSQPVKALSALADQGEIDAEGAKIMKIEPALKGSYHWLDTNVLSFDASEQMNPAVSYKITVNNALLSLNGDALTGKTEFFTKASDVNIAGVEGGVRDGSEEDEWYWYSKDEYSPEDAKYAYLSLNYYMTEAELGDKLSVTANFEKLSYTVKGDFKKARNATRVSSDGTKTTGFFIVIENNLPPAATIRFSVTNRQSGKTFTKSYSTVSPLVLRNSSPVTNWYGFEYEFNFNNEISSSSALAAFSSPDVAIEKQNIYVGWKTVKIKNLPVKPGERIRIVMSGSITDIYGSQLGKDVTVTAVGTDYYGRASFLDYGNKIMESQFPHKLLVDYMNITDKSYYRVGKTDEPLKDGFRDATFGERIPLDASQPNVRLFKEIDLDPYLTNGKGTVHFEAVVETVGFSYSGEKRLDTTRNTLNVQVTDLAATARLGANKAVVLVRSLSTGQAVKGASVTIENKDLNGVSKAVATDDNGCAVIPYNPTHFFMKYNDSRDVVFVRVKTEDDEVLFVPSTHNSWSSNVYPDPLYEVVKPQNCTFMFSDRGLYKPGETITFKGIDRDLYMGAYSAYTGPYTVSLEKYQWRNPTVFSTSVGETSASGGFHGSFDIPADLEPGEYSIRYKRTDTEKSDDYMGRALYFTVAYFEPLKIQSEMRIDSKDTIAGDTITADFKASYLAGGALADAQYETSWFSSGTRFSPENRALKDYEFGIEDVYDSRKMVGEEEGVLSSSGKSSFSCVTNGLLKPIPYEFRVETYVTDASDQRISASATKTVHPAEFYIGVGKPLNLKGFAKKGKQLELPFLAVALDGSIMKNSDFSQKLLASSLSCTLSRKYWTYDYQKSVDGSVYAQYKQQVDVENTSTVKFAAEGKIKVTPKEAGYYTLRVEGKDSKGRAVVTDYSFYVTGSGAVWGGDESAINLTCDSDMYNPGDTASILMESPLAKGDYLITVEREGIFSQEIRHIDEPTSVIDVKIARNYVPVVYVSVSTYTVRDGEPKHNYGEVDLDKPKSVYGVTPVFINPRVKAFSVKVETDKKIYRPGDTATVTLTATKGGKPVEGAELTAMACDRAVLDLIDYHVSDPIEFFYSRYRFPLYCYGGDSRDYLMDPVTYSIKNLQGGDADEEKDGDAERKEFKPTAFFEPLLVTDKNGKVSFTFKVPDNLTTFRITAFGVKDELLALQESEFGTQNPVNVQAVQPRRLRERDTAECGVVLTNLDSVAHEVSVSVQVRQPAAAENEDGLFDVAGNASIDGASSGKVKVAGGGTSIVYFDVAAEQAGFVELVYTIKSDVLNEKLVSKIQIEKSYILEKTTLSGSTDSSATEKIIIPSFADDDVGAVDVSLDASQLGLLGEAVKYVFHYPYGCMEQQSAALLPLVIFSDYIKPLGMESEVSNPKQVIKTYFKKWKKVQRADGGFPYWPDGSQSDFFVSLRIAHIYALARENGFSSRELSIDIDALRKYIRDCVPSSSVVLKAYACYVFSLLGDNGLDGELREISSMAENDLMAAAYAGLAWLKRGGTVASNADGYYTLIRSYMRPSSRTVDITQPMGSGFGRYYSTYAAQKAVILQFFTEYDAKDNMVDLLLNSLLLEQAYGGYWESTATTSRVLEAVRALIKARNLEATDFSAKCEVMKKSLVEEKFKGLTAKRAAKTAEFSSDALKNVPRDEMVDVNFSKKGKGTLYYTATLSYALPSEIQSARDEGFKVAATVYDYKTGDAVPPGNLIMALESGKTYKMRVEISSDKDRSYTAVRVPIPSGGEILDSTFKTAGTQAQVDFDGGWYFSSTKMYDNEAQFFLDWFPKGTCTIEFTFRAARRGVYPVVPALAECMYTPEVFGRSDGLIYTIK